MRRLRFLDRLGDLISNRVTRTFLTLLILISVLPYPYLELVLRPLFLLVFGAELTIRLLLLFTARSSHGVEQSWVEQEHADDAVALARRQGFHRNGRLTPTDAFFLIVDIVAFISFLPLESWFGIHQLGILTSLRLFRLLVLLRFLRAVLHDIFAIVVRRERFQQFALVTFSVIALSFVSAVVLSQLDIRHNYDDNPERQDQFWDQLWWAFRQLESADNLVPNLQAHPLLVVLSLLLTVMGVFIISFIIGLGSNVVEQLFKAEQRRPITYKQHSLVIGPVEHAEVLVREFVRIYNKHRALQHIHLMALWAWFRGRGPVPRRHALPRMALLDVHPEPPNYLHDPFMRWVLYRQGEAAEPAGLERVAGQHAKRVILLASRRAGREADGVTLVALSSLRSLNSRAHVFVEVQQSDNCRLMARVGGPNTFPLDVPRFLGLFLCQHLMVPGVEGLYRNLLTSGGSEFYTHIFVHKGEQTWLRSHSPDLTLDFAALVQLAYERYGVLLMGVFLTERILTREGDAPVATEGLVQWVNPLVLPAHLPEITAMGGRAGRIPVRTLAGFIAVGESYVPLQRLGRAFGHGLGQALVKDPRFTQESAPTPPDAPQSPEPPRPPLRAPGGQHGPSLRSTQPTPSLLKSLADAFLLDDGALHRVLIVGFSPALPFFLGALAQFVPGIHVLLVLNTDGLAPEVVAERIRSLGVGLEGDEPMPGKTGRILPLESDGTLQLFTTDRPGLGDFAARCLMTEGPVDAAVFLSEPESEDRDARSTLRLLRFARALETGLAPRGERLHVVAEFVSLARGRNVQSHVRQGHCGFVEPGRLRLTLVSTELIRNYFMVHSAFVPGVIDLYQELLVEAGQEIIRLDYHPQTMGELVSSAETSRPLLYTDLQRLLLEKGALFLAAELTTGEVVLNPPWDDEVNPHFLLAVYVLMDGEHRARVLRRRAELS